MKQVLEECYQYKAQYEVANEQKQKLETALNKILK